ncbi:hypothetical protein J2751_000706 [Halorubrum alkaliphilum]|uniref:C2H2-type domain-containing protein n=1 Tax=Halorubrum alkaliphilum TaxID=261290 RepID=A0A8T4GC89_9EURY|nr:hypothetical protein [Halorubrum alkaliphilum]MBP1921713.1 hypothetical protein [Halorubrum alkaliphilum]
MIRGDCFHCGEAYTKHGMSRHLRACLPESPGESTLHLRVAGARRTDYWLHLAVEADATLATLDSFLRRFWLECCGHMSAFTVGDTWYERPYSDDDPPIGSGTTRRSMDVSIGSVAGSADGEFDYEYDFGSTTALEIRVVDADGWAVETLADRVADSVAVDDEKTTDAGTSSVGEADDEIVLLARNRPPEIDCGSCGAPATKVCETCLWERGPDAWLCEACASTHEDDCSRPSYLPYVNSPRVGVCGYTG